MTKILNEISSYFVVNGSSTILWEVKMIGYLHIHLVYDKLQLVLAISFSPFVLPEQIDSTRKKK